MPVIWGLDLREIHYNKFKASYMWGNKYHLRRTKFILYQLAMILCVISESVGTAALAEYLDQQDYLEGIRNDAYEYNNDFVGVQSFNILVGVYVATIFGAAFFFDLIFPERHENRAVKLAWKACSLFACLLVLADAVATTVIVATRSAYVEPSDGQIFLILDSFRKHVPLVYRHNTKAIVSIAFIWPGLLATWASTYIMWISMRHDAKHGGPIAKHLREQDQSMERLPVSNKAVPASKERVNV